MGAACRGARFRRGTFWHTACEILGVDEIGSQPARWWERALGLEGNGMSDGPGRANREDGSKPVYPFIILAVVVIIAIVGVIVLFA
ncbi:MAG: hypothetical protein QOF01_4871 [Thermomicrobiales bacterium]|jgi:hypothetical protein|nr:hypothetical protein [Thermomicrobiales bacterium]MEA2598402.1 hypothetical protein [Thermomicrobiales bacterium]